MHEEIKQTLGEENSVIYENAGGLHRIGNGYNRFRGKIDNFFEKHPTTRKVAPYALLGAGLATIKLSGGWDALNKLYIEKTYEYLSQLPTINKLVGMGGSLTTGAGLWQIYQDTVTPVAEHVINRLFKIEELQ